MLNAYDQMSNVLPSITNTHVLYDIDGLALDMPTSVMVPTQSRRPGFIRQLTLASTFLLTAPTAPTIMPPSPVATDASTIASSRITYGEGVIPGRRISLREARQLALRANRLTEECLRADRVQAARVMASTAEEDEHA